MKYILSRSSGDLKSIINEDNPFFDKITTGKFTYCDSHSISIDSMRRNRKGLYKDFIQSGSNHRDEMIDGKKCACRDIDIELAIIDIDSLDELSRFISHYGRVVIEAEAGYEGFCYVLEIYDDYRE